MTALFALFVVAVYLGIAWAIIKHRKTRKGKYIAIAILILIPTGDEILGRIFFEYLCTSEAGIKVYQTVELPTEYWNGEKLKIEVDIYKGFDQDVNGVRPFTIKGSLDNGELGRRYGIKQQTKHLSRFFSIERDSNQVVDRTTGLVMGEDVTVRYWGVGYEKSKPPRYS